MTLRDLRHHAGQLLLSGFDGLTLPVELRAVAREFDLGGIVIDARNVEAPEQVAELAVSARELKREFPLWVAVDQEGGRVQHLAEPFTRWPPMATLGRANDVALTRRFARAMAIELAAVGITLDFAPVLDVLTNSRNQEIGDRALSDQAEEVAAHGRAIVETLQGEGLAAAGKHFPGHGETGSDVHDGLTVCEVPPDRLRGVECVPFRAAIQAQVAFLVTGHVLYPSIDDERPATLSPAIVQGLLREELGFTGAVLAGDLDAKALAARYTIEEAVVGAIGAGCDGVLVGSGDCGRKVRAIEALIRAAESDLGFARRIEDASTRMRRAKERFLARPAFAGPNPGRLRGALGPLEHQMVAEEMRQWL